MAFVIAESVLQLQEEKPPVLCNWMPVPQEALLQGVERPKSRRTQATGRSKFSSPVSRHNPFAYAWFDGWLGLPVGWRKA
jgi:hypothetical protein